MLNKPLLKSIPKSHVVLYALILCMMPLLAWGQEPPAHNRLEYQVSVSAQLIPVFAVDANGDPVYDLKQEELRLLVNGKPHKILYFNGYRLMMEEHEEQAGAVKATKSTQTAGPEVPAPEVQPRHPERLIFIVLDGMISDWHYLGASRRVALEIIRKASPGDAFLIMESRPKDGFKHIIGPEKDKEKLAKALGVSNYEGSGMTVGGSVLPDLASSRMGSGAGSSEEASMLGAMAANQRKRNTERYQRQLSKFSTGMGYLKHALKSTNLPKNLYLIAPGVHTAKLGDMPLTALRNLEDAAKSVNYGGSLFYLVNPIPRKKKGGDWGKSIRFMADVAGGKYISGSSFEDIASKVTKSTSAYYELAFPSRVKPGNRSRIQLTCTRPGVRLTTIANTEKERPYSYMKRMERELFVLNIIDGGGWSRRMLKNLKKIDAKVLEKETRTRKKYDQYTFKRVEAPIPLEMQNKKVHFYRVTIDDTTRIAKMYMFREKVKKTRRIDLSCYDGNSYYLVFIDPTVPSGGYCKIE